MPAAASPAIAIFRAGTHRDLNGRDITFSAEDLAQIASSYEAASPAPLVLGHPQTDHPAYGWASGLSVGEDGLLYAALDQVDASLADSVRAGRYRNVSASLWQPDHPSNPKPGSWYLRHIGLLGAAAPAITGLPPVNLASDDQVACFEFSAERPWAWREVASLFRRVRDWMVESIGVEKADQVVPSWQIESLAEMANPVTETASVPSFAASPAFPANPEPSMTQQKTPADFAARESALTTREQEIAAREKTLADREAADRAAATARQREQAASFAAELADAGRILPRHQAALVEVILALPPAPVSFAGEGGAEQQAEPAALLRDFLKGLPVQIEYGEKARGTNAAPAVAFAAPANTLVDADRLALLDKARAYQVSHPNTPFAAAVAAVGG